MANLLNDTFTGSNGTQLTVHTMDQGAGWSMSSSLAVALQIQSNRANGATGGSGVFSAAYADAGNANTVIALDLIVPTGKLLGGITARGSAWSDIWVFALQDDTGSQDYIAIYEQTGSVQTLRASANITSVQGTTVTMTVTVNGNNLRLQCGTGDINYTSAVRNGNTNMGLFAYFDGTYTVMPVDNFLVTTVPVGGARPLFRDASSLAIGVGGSYFQNPLQMRSL